MVVLSVEGPGFIDKGLWTTHKILGVFKSEEDALESINKDEYDDEDIMIVTDIETKNVKRVETNDV